MSGKAGVTEKRRVPRFDCAGSAEIVVPSNGLHFRGRIANLSQGGCLIEAKCHLERGTGVELCFTAEGIPLRVPANLMERRANGVGFRFGQLSGRRLAQIEALIAELEEERKKENPAPLAGSGIEGRQVRAVY